MCSIILEAPKLYLDTCHLIRIANLRLGKRNVRDKDVDAYRLLDEYIRERHFGLIFGPSAALEWVDGCATLASALEIASVVDSAALQYEFEGDTFVFLYEVLNELRLSQPNLILPTFDILFVRDPGVEVERALTVLKGCVPEFFDPGELTEEAERFLPQRIPFSKIEDKVRVAWQFKSRRPNVYYERVAGYKDAFNREVASFRATRPKGKPDVIGWMKRFLKIDRIISKFNTDANVDDLLSKLDLTRCPAIRLHLAALDKRIRAGGTPKDNDVDDWMYVPVVPYADLVLTERNLQHFIHQADPSLKSKVTHDPNTAVKLLDKWLAPVRNN